MSQHGLDYSAVVTPWSVAQPAAGAEWSFTVPSGFAYKFETGFFTLVTSAVVANRVVKLQITDGVNIVWEGGLQNTYAASATARVGLTRGGGQTAAGGSNIPNIAVVPDVWLPAGYVLKTSTSAIDVADQYSAIHGLVSASTAI